MIILELIYGIVEWMDGWDNHLFRDLRLIPVYDLMGTSRTFEDYSTGPLWDVGSDGRLGSYGIKFSEPLNSALQGARRSLEVKKIVIF